MYFLSFKWRLHWTNIYSNTRFRKIRSSVRSLHFILLFSQWNDRITTTTMTTPKIAKEIAQIYNNARQSANEKQAKYSTIWRLRFVLGHYLCSASSTSAISMQLFSFSHRTIVNNWTWSEWTEYLYAFVIVCFHTKLLYSIHLNGTLDICFLREFRLERLLLCVYSSSRLFFLQMSLFILQLPIDLETSPVKQSTIFIIRIPGNERELPSRKNGQNQENKNTFLHVPR